MRTRRAQFVLGWNGTASSDRLTEAADGITYTDPASGEADSIDININDRDRKWISAWMPSAGDTMTAKIKLQDWEREGDNRVLSCGFFVMDSFAFSGWPTAGTISGVSTPADSSFMATERSKIWENITIKEIAAEVASRAGISLFWDAGGVDFRIKTIEQSKQTDSDFLMGLCTTYGLSMKVYSQKIVIFDQEQYKQKPSAMTLYASDLESWNWSSNLAGTYTGGEFTYTDPRTEAEIVAKVGGGSRIFKDSGKADSTADAERKIKASVANANHGSTKMSVVILGNARLYAGQCVDIAGLGKMSGKYYIDKVTHTIGSGYTMSLELSLVE